MFEVIHTVFHYDRVHSNMGWNNKYFLQVRPPWWPLDPGALDGVGMRSVVLTFSQSECTVERPMFEVIHTIFHYDRMSLNCKYFPWVRPPRWPLDPGALDGAGVRSVVLPFGQQNARSNGLCLRLYTQFFITTVCVAI